MNFLKIAPVKNNLTIAVEKTWGSFKFTLPIIISILSSNICFYGFNFSMEMEFELHNGNSHMAIELSVD